MSETKKAIGFLCAVIAVVYAVIEVFFGDGIRQWWDQYGENVLWGLLLVAIIIVIVLIIWRMRDRIGRYFDEKREEKIREESLERQRKFDEDKKRKEEEEIAKGNKLWRDPDSKEERWVSPDEYDGLEKELYERLAVRKQEYERREQEERQHREEKIQRQKEFEAQKVIKIIRTIEEFDPRKRYELEKDYQETLFTILNRAFPQCIFEKQKSFKNPDYEIEQICIELKGPTDKHQLDTVSEKVPRYLKEWDHMIVVLYDITTSQTTYENWKDGFMDMINRYQDADGKKRVFLIEDISSFKNKIRESARINKKSLIDMKWFDDGTYNL